MKKRCVLMVLMLMLALSLMSGCGSNEPAETEEPPLGVGDGMTTAGDGEASEPEPEVTPEPVVEPNVKADAFMLPEIEMLTGESVDLQHQFAKKKFKVNWESSDPSVVKVGANGSKITAKHPGEATVEGKTDDGAHRFRCEVSVEKKPKSIIYLTFDDGPSRYSTPKILDILKENGVNATFFEINPDKEDYDLKKRILKEGNTLAIHGYSHEYSKIYCSDEAYRENITKLQKLFYKEFKVWCTQTRFPGGSSNTISRHYSTGIMTRLSKKVHKWGFKYQDWNADSGDADPSTKSEEQEYNNVITQVQPNRENVLLMHDFWGNDKTINVLPRVIAWGKENGYTFRAMTAATTEVCHGTNN